MASSPNARKATVCVTCVGGRLIYDIIRGVRMTDGVDVSILGVDADPSAHGRLLCNAFDVVPRIDSDEHAFIDRLLSLHAKHHIDVLILLSESETRAVAKHREEFLAAGIQVSVSSYESVAAMTDKLSLLSRAAKNGIEVGPFCGIDSELDALQALRQLGYPQRRVVIKPRCGAGSRGVLIVDGERRQWQPLLPNRFCGTGDFDCTRRAMEAHGMSFSKLIAVPYTGGPVYDVDCIARSGKLLDVATRLRQLRNPLSPTSTGHKLDLNSSVIAVAKELCAAFEIDGAADYDIAIDENGHPVLFDAGARFSGSVGGSLTAGCNFPGQLVRQLLQMPHKPMFPRDGCVLRPYITMAEIQSVNEQDYL